MSDLLLKLFDHMEWANGLVLSALRAQEQPDAEALRLFAHVLGAEETWIARIRARPPRYPVWPSLSAETCAALAGENRDAVVAILRDAGDDGLEREVRYRNSAGFEFVNTLGDILTHIALHGSHHRGQIAKQLRSIGTVPPYMDYIGFARREQPGGTLDAGHAGTAGARSQLREAGS